MRSRLKRRAASGTFVLAIVQPYCVSATDEDARLLLPSSSWTLDFADERCSLIREFADGDASIRIQIDSFGPTFQGYRVMLSGELVPGSSAAPLAELRIGYSPDGGERPRHTLLVGKFQDENAVSFRQGFLPEAGIVASSSIEPGQDATASGEASESSNEFEDGIDYLTLDFRLRDILKLETGNMAEPFAAMRLCVDDLIASWGFDPAEFHALSRRVQLVDLAEGQEAISPSSVENYPGRAERRRREYAEAIQRNGELVPVRLSVNSSGEPTACVVQVAFATEDYRQTVCEGLRQHEYRPALDASGQPIDSFIQFETR